MRTGNVGTSGVLVTSSVVDGTFVVVRASFAVAPISAVAFAFERPDRVCADSIGVTRCDRTLALIHIYACAICVQAVARVTFTLERTDSVFAIRRCMACAFDSAFVIVGAVCSISGDVGESIGTGT